MITSIVLKDVVQMPPFLKKKNEQTKKTFLIQFTELNHLFIFGASLSQLITYFILFCIIVSLLLSLLLLFL